MEVSLPSMMKVELAFSSGLGELQAARDALAPSQSRLPKKQLNVQTESTAFITDRRWGGRGCGWPGAGVVGGPVGAHLAVEQRGHPRRAQQQSQPRRALHRPPARWLTAPQPTGGAISAGAIEI